jgi:hypothetical protein
VPLPTLPTARVWDESQEVPALSDEHQIEAEDDCRICVRRGLDQETKPKKRQRKMETSG